MAEDEVKQVVVFRYELIAQPGTKRLRWGSSAGRQAEQRWISAILLNRAFCCYRGTDVRIFLQLVPIQVIQAHKKRFADKEQAKRSEYLGA